MKNRLLIGTFIILLMVGGCTTLAKSTDAPRMTKEELKTKLDSPDLVIIDVRYGTDWTDSDLKIKGAIREDPSTVDSWASKYPKDRALVFYCA